MKNLIVSMVFVFTLILLFTGLLLAENDQKLSEKKKQELSKQSSELLVPLDKEEKTSFTWNEAEFRRYLKEVIETNRKIEEMINTKLDQLAEKLELYRKNPEEIIKKAKDLWLKKRRSAIYTPVLDKLEIKIRKGSNSKTIQNETEQVFKTLSEAIPSKSTDIYDGKILRWAHNKKTEEQLAEKKEEQPAKLSAEEILNKPINSLSAEERDFLLSHPCLGNLSYKIEMEETINDWTEKRRMEIWGRLFDKLTEDKRLKKSKVETTLKDIEKAFDELTRDLLREDNIQKELEKSLSKWHDKECKKEKEEQKEILSKNTSNIPSLTDEEKNRLLFDKDEFLRKLEEKDENKAPEEKKE